MSVYRNFSPAAPVEGASRSIRIANSLTVIPDQLGTTNPTAPTDTVHPDVPPNVINEGASYTVHVHKSLTRYQDEIEASNRDTPASADHVSLPNDATEDINPRIQSPGKPVIHY